MKPSTENCQLQRSEKTVALYLDQIRLLHHHYYYLQYHLNFNIKFLKFI